MLLFEGGAFEAFVKARGVLLPEDELDLAGRWLEVDRSVHEIESVTPGSGLVTRDLRSDERREVRAPIESRFLNSGDLLCARIVPAGDTIQVCGEVEIVLPTERDALITLLDQNPDARSLMEFLSRPSNLRSAPGRGCRRSR